MQNACPVERKPGGPGLQCDVKGAEAKQIIPSAEAGGKNLPTLAGFQTLFFLLPVKCVTGNAIGL